MWVGQQLVCADPYAAFVMEDHPSENVASVSDNLCSIMFRLVSYDLLIEELAS